MADTLEIFGKEYTGVTGIKATDDSNQIKTYIRPQGSTTITSNGTVDVTNLASVIVEVSGGGGGSGMQVATLTSTPYSTGTISFSGMLGQPTSFAIVSENDIATSSTRHIASIVYDGTTFHGQTISNTNNEQVSYVGSGDFTPSYSNGTLVISASSVEFSTSNTYKLVYTYNGSSSNIDTKEVQVGSGATSITFTGLEAEPDYFSCIFKSYFNTSSGYQRVIVVANDGSDTYGMEMDSSAKYSDAHWSYSYSNGSLTITSQGTNAGGYFHQPGYYQLTYGYSGDSGGANYQTKTVTPTTSQQVVTADSGYDALEQVTVNAIPSQYIVPSGNLAITQNGNNINVAQYSTVSVSVESSGGSSNIVEGTFTTGSSAGVSSVTIPYTGSGYPISCIVVVEGGAYNSAISGWYNSMQRYAVGQWTMTKAVFTSSPTYTTSGTQNQGVTTWVYKNSTSSSTSYSRSSAMNTNAFSSSNASNAGATCVRLKSGNVLSYYVNTSSYGLLPDTTYRYIITYSS